MDEQLRIILIILVSVAIFGLLVFVFVKNFIKTKIEYYLNNKKKLNVVFSFSNILEISSKFNKRTKIVIIKTFIKIYFVANVKLLYLF